LATLGAYSPVFFGVRDEIAHQKRQQKIINHRTVIVAVQLAAAFFEDGAPEKHRTCQGHQPEEGAQKVIPPIHTGVPQPDVKDRTVLVRLHAFFFLASSTARLIAAIMLSGRAIPLPAISNAV